MAKVATRAPLTSNSLHFGNGGAASKVTTAVKRKTPSELRGEQLKRKNAVEIVDESSATADGSVRNTDGEFSGFKKPEQSKNPRYIDTRMDELFPVRKNSIRLKLLSKKENNPIEHSGGLKTSSVTSNLAFESQPQLTRLPGSLPSIAAAKDGRTKLAQNKTEKCSESTFRSVTELSLGGGKSSGLSSVDMDKAMKGLVACEPPIVSASTNEFSERLGNCAADIFCSEFNIPCQKIPLDFTLKSSMRVVSSSSVNWFHRLINCATSNGCIGDQNMTCTSEFTSTARVSNRNILHSWVYPQSSLPSSVISALTQSVGERGQMDFLSKRQMAWEDAFRSLYYTLRKKVCNIFYVCTAHFVVMFTGGESSKEGKYACNAYISQSTTGLRSLLKEHGVSFSMPLCHTKEEQVTTEDLVELSEMEKHNPGQTRRLVSASNMDNSPQSLLVFSGNENVHGLFDFILNYRFILTSLAGADVPLLYSPVPFENAALSAPEVRCKEVKRPDHISYTLKESNIGGEHNEGASSGFCYIIEIKDAYLPPWTICSICDAMHSDGNSFEASFVTDSASIGLNVGLDTVSQESITVDGLEENNTHCFSIRNAVCSSHLRLASLKGLKYSNGNYTASLSPV